MRIAQRVLRKLENRETGFEEIGLPAMINGMRLPPSRLRASLVESLFRGISFGLPVICPEPRNLESLVSALFGEGVDDFASIEKRKRDHGKPSLHLRAP
jgi:hypothetical protein